MKRISFHTYAAFLMVSLYIMRMGGQLPTLGDFHRKFVMIVMPGFPTAIKSNSLDKAEQIPDSADNHK